MWGNDNADAVATMPAIPAVTGSAMGWWSPGDPYGTGALPSAVTLDHMNIPVAELLNILKAAGITPVKSNTTQVLAALQVLFGGSGNLATPLGHWTLPGGLTINWGTGTSGANGATPIVYDKAYASKNILTLVGEQNAIGWTASSGAGTPTVHGVEGATLTGCTLYSQVWNTSSAIWSGAAGIAYGFISIGF